MANRIIHRRLSTNRKWSEKPGAEWSPKGWPDSSGSQGRIKGASGKISRNEQGLGASKAFADWQSRQLPYLAQVSSRFPLIHSVQFGPLPLPPSCHPGQDSGLKDPRSPGRFRGPSPFPIDPTSLEPAMPHLCGHAARLPDWQTGRLARLCSTVQRAIQSTRSQWLTGRPTSQPHGRWVVAPVRISFLIPGLSFSSSACLRSRAPDQLQLQQVHSQPPAPRLSPRGANR